MLYSGTDPESYITEYTLVYQDKHSILDRRLAWRRMEPLICIPTARYVFLSVGYASKPPAW